MTDVPSLFCFAPLLAREPIEWGKPKELPQLSGSRRPGRSTLLTLARALMTPNVTFVCPGYRAVVAVFVRNML